MSGLNITPAVGNVIAKWFRLRHQLRMRGNQIFGRKRVQTE